MVMGVVVGRPAACGPPGAPVAAGAESVTRRETTVGLAPKR